jgi:hypothetical protein
MENQDKNKGGKKTTTKLPKEIEEFLKQYREWYKRFMEAKQNDGIPPDDDPPNPPGGGDDDGE